MKPGMDELGLTTIKSEAVYGEIAKDKGDKIMLPFKVWVFSDLIEKKQKNI